MTSYRDMDSTVKQQYTSLWGAYSAGDFSIGDPIKAPGISGEVIWSFKKEGHLYYVIGSDTQWPVEVKASEILV